MSRLVLKAKTNLPAGYLQGNGGHWDDKNVWHTTPAKEKKPRSPAKSKKPTEAPHDQAHVEKQVHNTIRRLSGYSSAKRVRIADVHKEHPEHKLEHVHEAINSLQRKEKVVAMRIDDPSDIKPEDHKAAMHIAGNPRHIVYNDEANANKSLFVLKAVGGSPGKKWTPPKALTSKEDTSPSIGQAATQAAQQVVSEEGANSHEKGGHVFGEHKVFISGVHKKMQAQGYKGSLHDFKQDLVEAHRKGHVEMTRADLPAQMPKKHVDDSETHRGESRLHMIVAKSIASHKLAAGIAKTSHKQSYAAYQNDQNPTHLKQAVNHAHAEALAHYHADKPEKTHAAVRTAAKYVKELSSIGGKAAEGVKEQHEQVKAAVKSHLPKKKASVLGHTSSGKPVSGSGSMEHATKHGYTAEDHVEAGKMHEAVAYKTENSAKRRKHMDASDRHFSAAENAPKAEKKPAAKPSEPAPTPAPAKKEEPATPKDHNDPEHHAKFEHHFNEGYEHHKNKAGRSLVELRHLRTHMSEKMPDVGHEQFNQHIKKLRNNGKYALEAFEGRHGSLKPEDKDAGFHEGGRNYIYAYKRHEEKSVRLVFDLNKSKRK